MNTRPADTHVDSNGKSHRVTRTPTDLKPEGYNCTPAEWVGSYDQPASAQPPTAEEVEAWVHQDEMEGRMREQMNIYLARAVGHAKIAGRPGPTAPVFAQALAHMDSLEGERCPKPNCEDCVITAGIFSDPERISNLADAEDEEPITVTLGPGDGRRRKAKSKRRANETAAERRARLGYTLASEHDTKRVKWLSLYRLPAGALAILNGDPDLGKSTVTSDWSARTTTGRALFGEGEAEVEPGAVLIISAEDTIETTIKPRLEAAGADLDKVAFIMLPVDDEGRPVPLTIPEDLTRIENIIRDHRARLVIIDPITAYLGKTINTNNDASVRTALTPLKYVAEQTGACVILIRHLNKDDSKKALYRGGGSIGFTAASRAEMVVGVHPEDPDMRVLAWMKSNLAPAKPVSLAYRLETHHTLDVAQVVWAGSVNIDADTLLRGADGRTHSPKLEEAKAILADIVTKPVKVAEIKEQVKDSGIGWDTFQKARDALGLRTRRIHDGKRIQGWVWEPRVVLGDDGKIRFG